MKRRAQRPGLSRLAFPRKSPEMRYLTNPTKRNITLICLLLSFLVLMTAPEYDRGLAQTTANVQWEEPLNLSDSPSSSTYPALVTDPYGYVHVFWAEDLGGEPITPLNQVENSNSIVYTQWNGSSWSKPIDLFYSAPEKYQFPYAAITPSGMMHLVWQGYHGVYYSSVPVEQAQNVRRWSSPTLIASSRGDGPRLFADKHGGLHLIYATWNDARTDKHDGNVYYRNSADGGKTWSAPARLSNIPTNSSTNASHPSIFIDSNQGLHATWFEASPPNYTGDSVQYTRSLDGGQSWATLVEIGQIKGNERWASMPEIIGTSPADLHITWVCGENAHRCHRRSVDGGMSWTGAERVFGDMLSLAGWDTQVVDGSGRLYWILQLREPGAIYLSSWTGSEWSDLSVVNNRALEGGHYLRAAVHNGNQLDLMIVDQNQKEIWYMSGETGSRPLESKPTPTLELTHEQIVTETPTLSFDQTGVQVTPQFEFQAEFPSIRKPGSGNNNIWISSLPVVGLIVFVVIIRNRLRKKN